MMSGKTRTHCPFETLSFGLPFGTLTTTIPNGEHRLNDGRTRSSFGDLGRRKHQVIQGNDTTQRTVKRRNATGPIITAKINRCIISISSINFLRSSILDPVLLSLHALIYIYIGQGFVNMPSLSRPFFIYKKHNIIVRMKQGSGPWV